jgi:hypothetical protein
MYALGADIDGSGYDVTLYRGAIVGSRAAWVADAESRGGVITQVPGGFWHDIECARFGDAPPYLYELPPVWLLVWDGVDVATQEFLELVDYTGIAEAADNQRQDVANIGTGAAGAVNGLFHDAPAVLKYAAIGGVALLALNLLSRVPRNR